MSAIPTAWHIAPFHFGRLNHPFKLDVFHGKVPWKSLPHVPVPWDWSPSVTLGGCQALEVDVGPGNAEDGALSILSSETTSP